LPRKKKRLSREVKRFLAFLLAIPALMLIGDAIKQMLYSRMPGLQYNPEAMFMIGIFWLLAIYLLLGVKKWD